VEVAGFAAAIYWIVKSLIIIPIGRYLDKNHGEKDDLAFVVVGNLLAALSVTGYLFAYLPWHVYILQVIFAIGMGMNIPGYTAIFTRHIDKGKEAYEWSVRGATSAVGTGVAGAVGGVIAHNFGFEMLFLCVALFYIVSAVVPFFIAEDISGVNKKTLRMTKTVNEK
jgi:MFS family permease